MVHVIQRPNDLVYIWASLKRGFENIISKFLVANCWSWKEFAKLCDDLNCSVLAAYLWIGPLDMKVPERERQRLRLLGGHRIKVTKLILRTGKEFWLPRRELIEDEYILSMNDSIRRLPLSKQAQEKQELILAARIAKFKRRLGGFYVLWALYWNQPTPPKECQRIEITPYDYETIKKFESELRTLPIHFMPRASRLKLIKEVEFMLTKLVNDRAYDVCMFAEEYYLRDSAYLSCKYNGKAEVLEWEKSLKERLLFHPKIMDVFQAYKHKWALEQQVLQYFDPGFIAEALELLKPRTRGSSVNQNKSTATDVAAIEESQPQPGTSRGDGFTIAVRNPTVKTENEGSTSRVCRVVRGDPPESNEKQDAFNKLGGILVREALKSPYELQDLIPPLMYRTFERMRRAQARISAQQSRNWNIIRRKSKRAKRRERAPKCPKIDFGNIDNLAPVLEAVGLTGDIKSRADPALKLYFTKLFEEQAGKQGSNDGRKETSSHETSTASKMSMQPPEWNLIWGAKINDYNKIEISIEDEPKEKKAKPFSLVSQDDNYSTLASLNMPSVEETEIEIKSEPVSPEGNKAEDNADDFDYFTECEKAIQLMLTTPKKKKAKTKVEPTSHVDESVNSSDDETTVEEILHKLINFPGLLGDFRKSPVRKRKAPRRNHLPGSTGCQSRKVFLKAIL